MKKQRVKFTKGYCEKHADIDFKLFDLHLTLRIGYYKLNEEEEKKGKRYSGIIRG
jgi:hypothetical protein